MIEISIDPNLVTLGPFVIAWHGVFTAVGVVVGVSLALALARLRGLNEDATLNVAMWGIVGAIIGSRLVHVVDQWQYYLNDPVAILRIYEGGLAIWGTVIGGPLAGAIYARRAGLPIGKLADVASPALALGMAIGRIGDIINGEHHGVAADGFVPAVVYTHPNTLGEIGVPVHLAVGYELLVDLALMVILLWVLRYPGGQGSRLPVDGMAFWVFTGLYSLGVFVVRFWRTDTRWLWGLSQAQLLALLGAAVSAWMLIYLYSRLQRARLPRQQRRARARRQSEVSSPKSRL